MGHRSCEDGNVTRGQGGYAGWLLATAPLLRPIVKDTVLEGHNGHPLLGVDMGRRGALNLGWLRCLVILLEVGVEELRVLGVLGLLFFPVMLLRGKEEVVQARQVVLEGCL